MSKPRRKPTPKPRQETPTPAAPTLLRLDACQKRNLSWLWDQRIPLDKATLLVGDPDSGKSFIALDLAARVSRGHGVPPEPGLQKPGQVLLLCADDDARDTILPRLRAADADLHQDRHPHERSHQIKNSIPGLPLPRQSGRRVATYPMAEKVSAGNARPEASAYRSLGGGAACLAILWSLG